MNTKHPPDAHTDNSGNAKPKDGKSYTFHVNGVAYQTDSKKLTGAEIKAMVVEWDSTHDLALEGEGDDPDRIIADDETVNLSPKHGRRFSSVPKANFG